jgi:hypothetical protein
LFLYFLSFSSNLLFFFIFRKLLAFRHDSFNRLMNYLLTLATVSIYFCLGHSYILLLLPSLPASHFTSLFAPCYSALPLSPSLFSHLLPFSTVFPPSSLTLFLLSIVYSFFFLLPTICFISQQAAPSISQFILVFKFFHLYPLTPPIPPPPISVVKGPGLMYVA